MHWWRRVGICFAMFSILVASDWSLGCGHIFCTSSIWATRKDILVLGTGQCYAEVGCHFDLDELVKIWIIDQCEDHLILSAWLDEDVVYLSCVSYCGFPLASHALVLAEHLHLCLNTGFRHHTTQRDHNCLDWLVSETLGTVAVVFLVYFGLTGSCLCAASWLQAE